MSLPYFRGSFVALITPFDRKKRVDFKVLESLVDWHISQGTDGIVCCGTTGESLTLSDKEKKQITEICVRTSAKRIPIIVGTGTSDTRQSVKLTENVKKLGADGCLVITPYYNKPSQTGCILHFKEVAKVGLPLIVYHNPGRAVVRLKAETIAEIAQLPNVVAIKESSHDLELVRQIRKLSNISIFSGEDDLSCQIIEEGAVGAISVIGNVIPKAWSQMVHFALEQNWKMAKLFANRYLPLCKALFLETNPQCIKFAMQWLGLIRGDLRLPLTRPEIGVQKEIKRVLLALSLLHMQPFSRSETQSLPLAI